MLLQLCIVICLYISCAHTYEYACIHDDFVLQHNDSVLYTVSHQKYGTTHKGALDTTSAYPNANNTQPLRFFLDTSYLDEDPGYSCFVPGEVINYNGDNHTCTDNDILTADREEYIRRILIPDAHAKITSIFRVMPVDGPLYLSGGICGFQGGIRVPESYTRSGVGLFDTDLVVFVTARPVLTPHVLAFAGQCQEDQTGRAIAGHLNLNPTEVDVNPESHEGQLGIVLHELTHVLGFSYGKFSNFHAPPGRSSTGYQYVTSTALAHSQTESIAVINTPTVVQFVRDHFGCDTIPGAPLENGGGGGTKLSHWERRTFMNEYMTGEATKNPVFSNLTLSLFQDSGWYTVNFSAAENLMWGKGMGCDFALNSCGEWPTEGGYRCEKNGEMACSFDMQAKGSCDLSDYDQLPLGNQYFSSATKGGPDFLADYCPYYRGDAAGWCFDKSNADIPSLIDNGETFCKNCRCFGSSLVRDFPFGGSRRLACYQVECASDTDMKVKVGKLWYSCTPNATIAVEGYGGHIYCPKLEQIKAVCAESAYVEWPTVTSVNPSFGSPGTEVTIIGTGFSNVKSVRIHEECVNVTVNSDTEIVAIVPTWKNMGNPAHFVAQQLTVVVADKDGRTGLGSNLFSLRMSEDPMFIIHFFVWLVENWLAFLSILGAIGAIYFVRYAQNKEREQFRFAEFEGDSVVQSQYEGEPLVNYEGELMQSQ